MRPVSSYRGFLTRLERMQGCRKCGVLPASEQRFPTVILSEAKDLRICLIS